MKLTPAEEEYLSKVMQAPLEFSIPKDKSEEVWGRIQSFIGRYSSMKIQVATDYVLQTYNPQESAVDFGYYANRTPQGDEVGFEVRCICGNMFSGKDRDRNAHILAHYAQTGEIIPRLISQ
jgi:hypothetical protein